MTPPSVDSFIRAYLAAIREDNAAVFAGAGLSIPAGMVDWRGLLREMAKEVGLDIDRESDLVAVAQFHVNEMGGRNRINQALVTEFAERAALSENHHLLASLPIQTYWTVNYDGLIEQALRAAHKRPDVKATTPNLATTLPRRDAIVYKMHGDVSQPDSTIVTRDDYEAYEESHRAFSAALQGDLVSKTFLFLGFSFSDPNLNYILGRIRLLLGPNRRDHYCLMRTVHRTDFPSDSEYEYAKVRQELQIRDLRRYGIMGLLLADFAEYTAVLRRLASGYRRGRVFVSGSAATFEPWNPADAQVFTRELGQRLIASGFDLVSGFGAGIGPSLLNGVLDALEGQGSYSLHDRVILRPFPRREADAAAHATRRTAYRKEMVSHAGIGLFLFGNRRGDGDTFESAEGVLEEFEIAVQAGLDVVPIGATGHIAAELHGRVLGDFDRYYPGRSELRTAFEALASLDGEKTLVERVVGFLSRLREEG